eukprot:scaffold83221_cov29-Tisochrysis_lutea.AAC.3
MMSSCELLCKPLTYLDGVGHNTDGDEHGCSVDVDAGEGLNDSSSSQHKHGCDDDVGHDSEEQVHQVGGLSPAHVDDLKDSVGMGGLALDFHSQDGEQQHLHSGASSVPEGPRHAKLESHAA